MEITLSKQQVRRFLLAHQYLWPPRSLVDKQGILTFIEHVGCIQYDPVNLVGRNPDLVLQARLQNYHHEQLDQLLYEERLLVDGWDKMASIHLARDWPFFSRHRAMVRARYASEEEPAMMVAPLVRQEIAARGPLSSIDIDHSHTIDWMWGQPTRQVRAAMELLYRMGEFGIHHRMNSRRYFDLVERLLPAALLESVDPHTQDLAYQRWHVLRRVGSLGVANPRASEYWLGIQGLKAPQRREVLQSLLESGELVKVILQGEIPHELYLRYQDLTTLERFQQVDSTIPQAAFIGPLDNLLWDRDLLRWVFDFDYIWEIYKPARLRRYGAYVLPVLYGDRFVARMEAVFVRKTTQLTVRNWWWEDGVEPGQQMVSALNEALRSFADYLGAKYIYVEPESLAKWAG